MRKKAVAASLATIIITIVIFIFIFFMANQIRLYLAKSNAVEYCRISVTAMQAEKEKELGKSVIFHLDCPMQYEEIKDSDLPKDTAKYKDYVMREVANSMYDCWYKMGNGAYTNFENEWGGVTDTSCLLCSRINFDLKNEIKLSVSEADAWLKKNSLPKSSQTYSSYLSYKDQPGYSFVGKDTDLSTNDDYYIVFFVLRKDLPLERARATLTSLGIDYFYTPSEGYASVKIAREGDFSQIGCESLLN